MGAASVLSAAVEQQCTYSPAVQQSSSPALLMAASVPHLVDVVEQDAQLRGGGVGGVVGVVQPHHAAVGGADVASAGGGGLQVGAAAAHAGCEWRLWHFDYSTMRYAERRSFTLGAQDCTAGGRQRGPWC